MGAPGSSTCRSSTPPRSGTACCTAVWRTARRRATRRSTACWPSSDLGRTGAAAGRARLRRESREAALGPADDARQQATYLAIVARPVTRVREGRADVDAGGRRRQSTKQVLVGVVVPRGQDETGLQPFEHVQRGGALADARVAHLDHLLAFDDLYAEICRVLGQLVDQLL